MLQIFVNNIEVDIPLSVSISVKLISPFLRYDNIQGSHSMPFNLQVTAKNNRIFDFPHKLNKAKHEPVKLPFYLNHSGIQRILQGTISAKKTSDKLIDCDLRIDGGAFADSVLNSKLQEHEFGGSFEFPNTPPHNYANYTLFELINEDFFKDTPWDTSELYSEPVGNIASLIAISESSIADGELRPVTSEQIVYVYDALAITGTYSPFDDTDGIGYWEPTTLLLTSPIINSTNLTGNINPEIGKVITPFPYLYKIIRYLFNSLGYSVEDYIFSVPPLKSLVIVTNNDSTEYEVDGGGAYIPAPKYPFNMDLKNHLPDITIKQFLKDITSFFNVSFVFKNNKLTILKNDDIVKSTSYIDLTDNAEYIYTKNFSTKIKGVAISNTTDDTDAMFANLPKIEDYTAKNIFFSPDDSEPDLALAEGQDISVRHAGGIGSEFFRFIERKSLYLVNVIMPFPFWTNLVEVGKSTSPLSIEEVDPLQNYFETGKEFAVNTTISPINTGTPSEINNEIPEVRQTGNSIINTDKPVSNAFKLLFHKGVVDTQAGTKSIGGRMSPDESLFLGYYGNQGIIYNFWKETIAYKKLIDHYIDQNIKLSATEIKNFDFSKKIKVGQKIFIPDEVDISLSNEKISIAKCKLLPDYNNKKTA